MFDREIIATTQRIAGRLGVDTAALLAIAEVESGGKPFATVAGRREPLIRFEGHYFDRALDGEKRIEARTRGLASPVAGAVANPATQAARWALLARAAAIDHRAAHEAVSWGLGQVMGAHWRWLGFADIDALVAEARSGVDGQIALMARYIDKAGLAPAIRRRDWQEFARRYNGPAYAKHGYHTKIAAAHGRYRGRPDIEAPAGAGTVASSGRQPSDAVRDLQRLLSAAGYPVAADGVPGAATEKAVRRFQKANGLAVDGVAGPQTLDALRSAVPFDRWWRRLWRIVTNLLQRRSPK